MMNWANYALIIIWIIDFGVALVLHGKKLDREINAGVNFFTKLLEITLLYFGGWFR